MEEEIDRILIKDEEAGERIDKILALRYKNVRSRAYFQMLIEEHLVLINGIPVKKSTKPEMDDEIEIHFALTPEIDLTPENIPLDVLYEDDFFIVVNKPVGMVVHPAVGNWSGTFVNALLYHCRHLATNPDHLRPGIVHRLDKNTSGVLIAAKTSQVHQKLSALFSGREIYKEYLAICVGNPGDRDIKESISRHPVHRQRMAVTSEGGKIALTSCHTLHEDGKLSIVKIVISTGRTHQIRVHMQHNGTPILGDPLYGNAYYNKKHQLLHQMLHAHILRFTHPITGKMMEFKASIPQDMLTILNKIKPQFLA